MYSIKAIFQKEPAVIAGSIRSVLFVAVLMSWLVLDEKQLAGIALMVELVLTLFVRTNSTPNVVVEETAAAVRDATAEAASAASAATVAAVEAAVAEDDT